MVRVIVLLVGLLVNSQAWADPLMRVTFLNPGNQQDSFFGPLATVMQAAARDLNIDLEIVEANRNHLEMRRKGEEIIQRKNPPDYLLLINERDMAAGLIEEADRKGINVFLFNERLSQADTQQFGKPRERLTSWLGELLPDDRQSGYLLAKTLIDEAQAKNLQDVNGILHMIAINGAFKTSSAELRLKGLQDALKEYPNVQLHQTVYAHWEEEKAYKVTEGLLKRYPQTAVIWAASDGMAKGAMRKVVDVGQTPGIDVVLGGVDWADFAFDYVRDGRFTTTIGGHFLDGAWALIMLYDFHQGYDFRLSSGSSFSAITKDNVDKFDQYFKTANDWDQIDFRKFTKKDKSYFAPYDFSLKAIFKQLGQ